MAHDITDNRNEKLIDHVESILVFPLSLILSLKGHLDSRLRGNGIREGRPVGSPLRDAVPLCRNDSRETGQGTIITHDIIDNRNEKLVDHIMDI